MFLILFFFVFGFWASETQILQGTPLGDTFIDVISEIPVPSTFRSWKDSAPIETNFTTDGLKQKISTQTTEQVPARESNETDRFVEIEARVFERLQTLRIERNVPTLTRNLLLTEAANIRAQETELSFSHTRPTGKDAFTVLNETVPPYVYKLAGENLGMATDLLESKEIADLIFDGWVDSPGHYENMIHPDFREIGIGVHADEENIYITQLFGTAF